MTYLPETRRQLLAAAERRAGRPALLMPRPRLRLSWIAPALSLAVAAVIGISFLGIQARPSGRPTGRPLERGFGLVYVAEPTPQVPVITRAALERTVQEMRARLTEFPHYRASIRILRKDHIAVAIFTRAGWGQQDRLAVARILGDTARLAIYDWEANVLLTDGRTVASQLSAHSGLSRKLSQGGEATPTGSASAGALSLYQAVLLASKQPFAPNLRNSRQGSEYYLFARGTRRLLAGPVDPGEVSRRQGIRELETGLTRAQRRAGQVLVVKQGTVVLEAAAQNFTVATNFGDPNAGYYVLRDHVALFGNQISSAEPAMTQGAPTVHLRFTGDGADAFQSLTAAVARRGELLSTGSERLFQHFAIALDSRLITVPQIDFTVYPDGIATDATDLSAGFSRAATRGLAKAIQLGALPVKLKLVSGR